MQTHNPLFFDDAWVNRCFTSIIPVESTVVQTSKT